MKPNSTKFCLSLLFGMSLLSLKKIGKIFQLYCSDGTKAKSSLRLGPLKNSFPRSTLRRYNPKYPTKGQIKQIKYKRRKWQEKKSLTERAEDSFFIWTQEIWASLIGGEKLTQPSGGQRRLVHCGTEKYTHMWQSTVEVYWSTKKYNGVLEMTWGERKYLQ